MDKISLLKSVFVFSGLDETLFPLLVDQLREARFAEGEVIFRENETADSFFIVDAGEVVISKVLGPGQEKILAVLGPGSVFGEMAFFSDSPRTANAAARCAATLWKIDRAAFMNFIAQQPAAGLRILSGLLQVAMDRLEQTSRELATIYQTGRIINSGKNLADVVNGIRDELLLAMPEANGAAVYLYNEFNREYDPAAAPAGAREMAPDHPLLALLREKMSGIVFDTAARPGLPLDGFLRDARTVLLSPFVKDGKLLGFFAVWNNEKPRAFPGSRVLLASSVGSQLAESVENMRYQQEERDRQRLNNAKQRY